MQVYIEFAVLENFCMDFTLLYAAKTAVKNGAGWGRTAVAAAVGACFAVVFPLIPLNACLAVSLKIVSGLIICLIGCKFGSFRGYLKYTAVFLVFSALLAGALIGVFSLAGISYSAGNGYILSSVPVGIPLFGATLVLIGARVLKNKFSKAGRTEVECSVYLGDFKATCKGFFDSGNKVYARGVPVSVIPAACAEKLTDVSRINDSIKIHTVAGSRSMKIFTADRIEIYIGEKTLVRRGVKLGISPSRVDCAVLHPDLMEE